jgi:hypothetical protein
MAGNADATGPSYYTALRKAGKTTRGFCPDIASLLVPMRRFLRWSSNAIVALSTLLSVAACVLWVRGRYVGDDPTLSHASDGPPWHEVLLQGWSSGGGLRLVVLVASESNPRPPGEVPTPPGLTPFGMPGWYYTYSSYWGSVYPFDALADDALTFRGFQWVSSHSAAPGFWQRSWSIATPAWFVVLVFALPGARWVVIQLRQRRAKPAGFCASCGYDMRATPERCPECGTVYKS